MSFIHSACGYYRDTPNHHYVCEAPKMTERELIDSTVDALNALGDADPETAHIKADELIYDFAPLEVRQAYDAAAARIGFWYA